MILVHLTSTHLLRRAWAKETPGWLSVRNLFRFGDWDVMARTRDRTRRCLHLRENQPMRASQAQPISSVANVMGTPARR